VLADNQRPKARLAALSPQRLSKHPVGHPLDPAPVSYSCDHACGLTVTFLMPDGAASSIVDPTGAFFDASLTARTSPAPSPVAGCAASGGVTGGWKSKAGSAKGVRPVSSSCTTQPRAQRSTLASCPMPSSISGALYSTSPTSVYLDQKAVRTWEVGEL